MDVKEYIEGYYNENNLDVLKNYLTMAARKHNLGWKETLNSINSANNLIELKEIGIELADLIIRQRGGYHREMNVKDIKELCKANQIKLSRVVDGKRVAYKKKELMTKLKRKKLL